MENQFSKLVELQRMFFYSGNTIEIGYRINALRKLKEAIRKNEKQIIDALYSDLGKVEFESFLTEIGTVYSEIDYHIKHVAKWASDRRVKTPLFLFPSSSYIHKDPYGVTLIISPWNYPFHLAVMPLIGAISAGNTAIIKPSELSSNTSSVLKNIINSTFEKEYICVVEGGVQETTEILKERFDLIFFTGSKRVGKIIMRAASENLTPVILELGGKSPVIIDRNIDMNIVAKRIAFGKVLNSGQTCVAPDYVLVHEDSFESFIIKYKSSLDTFFDGKYDSVINRDYTDMSRMIDRKKFDRMRSMIKEEKILLGGKYSKAQLKVEPTLIDGGTIDEYLAEDAEPSTVMKEEIFGPLLPVIKYRDIDDCIKLVNKWPKPLSLYLFTNDRTITEKVMNRTFFGSGCINDTVVHLSNPELGFGGVGSSGMGRYHGKDSFDAFSHSKSILKNTTLFDFSPRYFPYKKNKLKLLRKIFK